MSDVLIASESLAVRLDLSEALDAAGFVCTVCATVAEARGVLTERTFALAILDLHFPDGDGIELLVKIRTRPKTSGMPVILLTAEAEVRDRVRALRRGADEHVVPPYDRGLVVARARALIRGPALPDLVLVIEDDEAHRAALSRELGHAGYAVAIAPDGVEGLITAVRLRPTAVIVDAALPGLDGPTTVRRMRFDPLLRDTPCLLLMPAGGGGTGLLALDAGADAYAHRTDDPALVVARVTAMLGGSAAAVAAAPVAAKGALRGERILAVDDSPLFRNALGDLLRNVGYDVALAGSGEEAIEVLAAREVDCILLDCVMPGLGGIEACRRIKGAPMIGDVPLIMLTMLDGGDSMIEGLAAGADDYIAKSAGFEVIDARIRSQIRRRQIEDEHRRVRERLLEGERAAAEAEAARAVALARASMAEQLDRASAQLAAANRELAVLSHSVSDGLRAPLRGISGFARALEEDLGGQLAPQHHEHLRRIQGSAARMGELIDSLLELARLDQAPLEVHRVDVVALVASLVPGLPADGGRCVTVRVEPQLAVQADPQLARTLFSNLLANAWTFTARTPDPVIEVGCSAERTYFVRDNGSGFDAATAERQLVPPAAAQPGAELAGAGISLAIARRIVERHGGRIWAESAPGGGATFYFTLPVAGAIAAEGGAAGSGAAGSGEER